MPCPTCNCDMTPIGCRVTERPFHWCPNCGTIKTCEEAQAVAPAEALYSDAVGVCQQLVYDFPDLAELVGNPSQRIAEILKAARAVIAKELDRRARK